MTELTINLDELAFVLHRGDSLKLACYLDVETGNIVNIPTDRNVLQDVLKLGENSQLLSTENMVNQLVPDGHHLLSIPDLFTQNVFELMMDFQHSVEESEPKLASELLTTIHGEGGFKQFRELIQKEFRWLKLFIRFRDSFFEEKAKNWLNSKEITPIHSQTF